MAGQVLPAFFVELFSNPGPGPSPVVTHTHTSRTRRNGSTPAAARGCGCLFIVMEGFYVQNLGSVKSLDEMG